MGLYTAFIELPVGAGPSNFSDYTNKLRSVIKISEQDNLCLFRAVVVGMAYADMNEQPENKALKTKYNQIIDKRKSKQTNEAIKLCQKVIKNYSASAMYGIADIVKIEQVIENYQIRVIHVDEEYKQIQYGGDEKSKKINLVYYENHFEMIKSLPAFYNMKSFCEICWTPYNCSFAKHKCNVVCKSCESRHCYESERQENVICQDCHVRCHNDTCLTNHKSKCKFGKVCNKCMSVRGRYHRCEGRFCINCKRMVDTDHQCFIKTEKEREDEKRFKDEATIKGYIFFDYECMVGEFHEPNLIIAEQICMDCINGNGSNCLGTCGVRSFKKNNEFCRWLIDQENHIAMAHNMKAYDGHFIMNFLVTDRLPSDRVHNILVNQAKILQIKVNKVNIIDSYNFIPFALSKFPKAFELNEMAKGYFPHLFNTRENQNKVFPTHPDIKFYQDKYMKCEEREKFLNWYAVNRNKQFDLNHELYKYCESDVDILKRGVLTFRKLFIDLTNVDPFKKSITIASLCQLVFRTLFMKPDTIPLIQDSGFNPTQNFSHKQMIWLKYISQRYNVRIIHCMNGQEKKIGPYSIDGYCEENNTVYKFDGFYIHGWG